jgi:fimbrial chaperone protein
LILSRLLIGYLSCRAWSCLTGLPRAFFLLAATWLVPALASAQLLIYPVVVEFGATQRIASVTVTLDSAAAEPMLLQADVLSWTQGLDGSSLSEGSDDLLVVPPMAELKPGEQQTFRIALRGPRQKPEEAAYRLILEDVAAPPVDASGQPGMAINFRMRHDLPVLLAPVGKVVNKFYWKPCPSEAKQACVRVFNAGNRRVSVQTLTLVGDGWQQALSPTTAETVLAGTEREWRVPLAQGQAGAPRGVQILSVRGETVHAETAGF